MALEGKQPLISALSVIRICRKRWTGIVCTTVAGIALTVGLSSQLPRVYKAETLIIVEGQKIPDNLVTSTVSADLQDRLATIRQQILSDTRLQTVIEQFNLYSELRTRATREEVIDRMRKDISVTLERGYVRNRPGAFRISYLGPNAETVTAVVNQLGSFFIEENFRTRETQARGTSEFLASQLDEAKQTLDELEGRVAVYKRSHSSELPQLQPSLLAGIGTLQLRLRSAEDSILRAGEVKATTESALAAAQVSFDAVSRSIAENNIPGRVSDEKGPAAVSEVDEVAVLQRRLDEMTVRYKEAHPEVKALRETIRRMKFAQLERAVTAPVAEAAQPVTALPSGMPVSVVQARVKEQERIEALRTQLRIAEGELAGRQNERAGLIREIQGYQSRVESLPLREQEMASLLRDYEISKANYETLLKKSLDANMSNDMETRQKAERFTVLDTARVPEKPVQPRTEILVGIGSVASLFASLLGFLAFDLKKNRVLGDWELPGGVTVLGRIPIIS
jgi:polysaccharide biosynthesis transport protein